MITEGTSARALRILHLEDSPQDAELIRERLSDAGFSLQLDWVATEGDFKAALERGGYDLVLADYLLPGFEAPAALVLTRSRWPDLPFILVSGATGEEKAVELLKQGVTDYVLKGRLAKLPLAIKRALDEAGAQKSRRLAEAALKQLNEELEQRVAERTAELEQAYNELKIAQSSILQQEKMASIGQLAAGVAHEINNPTGFILSNLRTLEKYADRLIEYLDAQEEVVAKFAAQFPTATLAADDLAKLCSALKIRSVRSDIKDLVAESIEGGERVKAIVQNMKSFARLDEDEMKPANLNQCLESTLNIVWNELKYTSTVTKDFGELPLLVCNPGQLNQVFLNLLINASQSIEGQGEITISTRCEDDIVIVTITDNGCGIQPDELSRIFEPFFSTKPVGKGTGLGLSIAYDIVKNHHGEIIVKSEPGCGSTFTIRLPIES